MPRNPPKLYDVRSRQTGAQVVIGVPLTVARTECARLNAEAKVVNPETGKPNGMQTGEITVYEVVSAGGLIVGGDA